MNNKMKQNKKKLKQLIQINETYSQKRENEYVYEIQRKKIKKIKAANIRMKQNERY